MCYYIPGVEKSKVGSKDWGPTVVRSVQQQYSTDRSRAAAAVLKIKTASTRGQAPGIEIIIVISISQMIESLQLLQQLNSLQLPPHNSSTAHNIQYTHSGPAALLSTSNMNVTLETRQFERRHHTKATKAKYSLLLVLARDLHKTIRH